MIYDAQRSPYVTQTRTVIKDHVSQWYEYPDYKMCQIPVWLHCAEFVLPPVVNYFLSLNDFMTFWKRQQHLEDPQQLRRPLCSGAFDVSLQFGSQNAFCVQYLISKEEYSRTVKHDHPSSTRNVAASSKHEETLYCRSGIAENVLGFKTRFIPENDSWSSRDSKCT